MYDGLHFELDEKKYQLGKTLGSGSYGVVVKAYDKINKRHVAVKQIPQLFDEIDTAKKIMREIQCMQSLRPCDYVLGLHDVELIKSNLYMIVSLCDIDLYQVTQSDEWMAKLDPLRMLSIFYQTLNAISFMHSIGILHRDIKPANLLLDENLNIRICDFGLARLSGNNSEILIDPSTPDLTEYVVSRWYRAPEIVLVPGRYGKIQDVWATACTFVEIYSRKILFPGETIVNQLHVIIDVIGKPSDDDLDFEMSERSKRYLNCLDSKNFGLDTALQGAERIHEGLAPLLKQMLQFNPRRRITSHEAVSSNIFESVRSPTDLLYMSSLTENIHVNMNHIESCANEIDALRNTMKTVVKEVRMELRRKEATLKKTKSQAEIVLKALNNEPPLMENSSYNNKESRPRTAKESTSNGKGLDALLPKIAPKSHTVQRVIQRRRSSENVEKTTVPQTIAPKKRHRPQVVIKRVGSIQSLATAESEAKDSRTHDILIALEDVKKLNLNISSNHSNTSEVIQTPSYTYEMPHSNTPKPPSLYPRSGTRPNTRLVKSASTERGLIVLNDETGATGALAEIKEIKLPRSRRTSMTTSSGSNKVVPPRRPG